MRLFCSPAQRRLVVERQENEVSNYHTSVFHNLPTELLYHVADHLPGLSLSSVLQTCRKFRATFEAHGHSMRLELGRNGALVHYSGQYFDGDDLFDYWLALRRDQFAAKCHRERRKVGPANLLCSACLKPHPRSRFTDVEASEDPLKRICKASRTGGLQSCNHLVIPFSSLQELRRKDAINPTTFFALQGRHDDPCLECPTAMRLHFCSEARRRQFFHPEFGSNWNHACVEPIRYTEPWTYKLVLQYTILSLPVDRPALVTIVASKLLELNGVVCPHIEMNSPEVLRSIYPGTTRAAIMTSSTVRWINDFESAYGDQWRWSKLCYCKKPNCDTKFRFALDRLEAGKQKIHLVVQREVGKLDDPDDLSWLAQRMIPLGYKP